MRVKTLVASAVLLASTVVASSAAQAAPTRYEAESSPAVCTGTIDSNWAGFSGGGFCNGNNATSGFAQFTVNARDVGHGDAGGPVRQRDHHGPRRRTWS